MSSQHVVKINVGGTVFRTKRSTLRKCDGFFKVLMDTHVPVAKDELECIIIHRSADHFRLILNFMRYGSARLPRSFSAVEEIYEEAKFYLLNQLMTLCEEKLCPPMNPDSCKCFCCQHMCEPKPSILQNVYAKAQIFSPLLNIAYSWRQAVLREYERIELRFDEYFM